MSASRLRRLVGMVILFVSLGLLLWGLLPAGSSVRLVPVLPGQIQLPTPESWAPLAGLFA